MSVKVYILFLSLPKCLPLFLFAIKAFQSHD